MALASSFSVPRSWQETYKPGSSVVLSDSRVTNSTQGRISSGFSESAQYLQMQIAMMAEWQNFISAISAMPDDVEKEIVAFLPPKSYKIVKAKIRRVEAPSILIADEDIR